MNEGVVLMDHASCSNWTYPSVLCVQTGMHALEVGVLPRIGDTVAAHRVDFPTIDYWLADHGYRSALTSANPYFAPDFGLGWGFDLVDVKGLWPANEAFANAVTQLTTLQKFGVPWYQHVHLLDPHSPYTADLEYREGTSKLAESPFDLTTEQGVNALHARWEEATDQEQELTLIWMNLLYEAQLRFLDAELAEFLADAKEMGALDRTLVVFWADHGEQFFENGRFGHGLDLHDEESDGFAFFWMAEQGLIAGSYSGFTSHMDLGPTFFDLLGLAPPEQFTGDVIGLADPARPRLTVSWRDDESAAAWQDGPDKLIYRWDGTLQIFDRTGDPNETLDRSAQDPERVAELWASLSLAVAEISAINPQPAPVDPGI
jgi:arylsulfatase A-like enzyme